MTGRSAFNRRRANSSPPHNFIASCVARPTSRGRASARGMYQVKAALNHIAVERVCPPGRACVECGGEGGIRTLGTLARSTVFETAPFDHSGTSPHERSGRAWRPPGRMSRALARPRIPHAERCRSGRSGRSRKPLSAQAFRGFESLPLRHLPHMCLGAG